MNVLGKVAEFMSDEYWDKISDPRIDDYLFFEGGLWRICLFMSLYLIFVTVILPMYMADRPPYQMKTLILAYNSIMVIGNFYAFILILVNCSDYGRVYFDFKFPPRDDRSEHTMWMFRNGWFIYMSRIVDLLDTVFFVLRKKDSQVTTLHLYHHSIVPILGWVAAKINGMAPTVRLFLLMNTFIHTVMYGYYALASFGPSIQKYLWWKKYITILQLGQFVLLGAYGTLVGFLQEGYPLEWFWPFFIQPPIFFLMFYDFYRKSYNRRSKVEKTKHS